MIDFSYKKVLSACILFAMGLLTLCGLSAPFLLYDLTGFVCLGFYAYGVFGIVAGVFALLQLFAACAAMLLAVIGLFRFGGRAFDAVCKGMAVACFCFLAVYCLEGIVLLAIINAEGGTGQTTLAYVPMLVGAAVLVFALFSAKLPPMLPRSAGRAGAAVPQLPYVAGNTTQPSAPTYGGGSRFMQTPQPAPSLGQTERTLAEREELLSLLALYNGFAEQGVITHDDFDRLKQELLGM